MMSNNLSSNGLRSIASGLIPIWLKGRSGFWALGAGIYMVVYSTWILFKWTDPAYETLIAGLGYLPLGFFAAVCAGYVAVQKKLGPNTRRAWVFISLSMISLVTADILYAVLELTRGVGFPDIPDILYLAYYPLAFIGLISIPTQVYDASQKKTWKLDLAIIVTSITAISWYFIIAPTAVSGGNEWMGKFVAGAYPAMDMLLLASVASILYRKNEINTRRSLHILGVGFLIYVIADISYAWLVLQDLYSSGIWVDIIWTLSYFAIGLAALRQANPYLVEQETDGRLRNYWQTSLLPFAALGASVIVSLYASSTGDGAGIRTNGLILGTAIAVFLTITRQKITIDENSRLVDDLNLATEKLRANTKILEERVVERTRDLESQTNRLHLSAQIAQEAASAKDLESLLGRATALILERFNLYHTGIYLLDQKGDSLVLTASPTEAGSQMIANNHKVGIEDGSIVSRAASSGEPHILLDVGQDTLRSDNPLLPNTRSEMTLPLKVENNVIGVLDVHSERPDAFNQDDKAIMQVLADQLATAIERTRLLQQVQQNLSELEQAYGRFTREGWSALGQSGLLTNPGYRFDNIRIQPISEVPAPGDEAIQTGRVVRSGNASNGNAVAIPIKLRGQTIGVVTAKLREGYDQNTISTIELAVERLAASLESARLYEESRMRADREQSISQVTAAISSSTEYEEILRTTVREIGGILKDTEVAVEIIADAYEQKTGG